MTDLQIGLRQRSAKKKGSPRLGAALFYALWGMENLSSMSHHAAPIGSSMSPQLGVVILKCLLVHLSVYLV